MRMQLLCVLAATLLFHAVAQGEARRVIAVWPDLKIPAAQRLSRVYRDKAIGDVARGPIVSPTLTLFPAAKKIATGCAVVICPGGGYSVEAMSLDGYRVARRFNKAGVSCFSTRWPALCIRWLKGMKFLNIGK